MSFIRTVPQEQADDLLREIYEGDLKSYGYIPGFHQVMSLRPEVIKAWNALIGSIRSHMSLRRYELVTMAAARAMRCRY